MKYYPVQSPLHFLDARVKIACLLLLTLAALALPFETAFLLFPLAISLFLLARIPLQQASWKTIATMSLFVFAIRALFQPAPAQIQGITIAKGVYYGILNAFYLAGVVLLVELLVKTTRPQELRDALRSFGLPKRLSLMLTIALQAIPLLQNKARKTLIAQKARGSERKLAPLALPLLHSVFNRAKKLSIALETRGFDPEKL